MNIVAGPNEFLRPLNVGLLFFNEHPDRFFPYTQIDVVHFPDGPGGDLFSEKIFKGPVHRMVREALSYIRASLILETVIKHPDRPEAERFYNYPYEAIEEALVNAVYHRGYDIREPVEVRVLPDCVTICSQPGPDRSIPLADLKKKKFVSRRYRNRRIGEFLKELELTEGRGTGIPKIMRAIKKNRSPEPRFETDTHRTFFTVTFPIHPKAKTSPSKVPSAEQGVAQLESRLESQLESLPSAVLRALTQGGLSKAELAVALKQKQASGQLHVVIRRLLEDRQIERTIPDKPNSRLQKYRLTPRGKARLAH